MTNVAVIYYSATGNIHTMAKAAAQAAEKAGTGEVRLRKVAELAPIAAVESNPAWAEHASATADVAEASVADVEWADVILFGTPTRFGLPAAQLKQFIDSVLAGSGNVLDASETSDAADRAKPFNLLYWTIDSLL